MEKEIDKAVTVAVTVCESTVTATTSGAGGVAYAAPVEQSLQWYELRIRYGLLTLFNMPREKLGPSQRVTLRLDYVHDGMDAGRWNKTRRPIPGPRALDEAIEVDEWLSWIEPEARKIVKARALGASWADLIMRTGFSQSTLQRRCREALTLIRGQHLKAGQKIA